MAHDLERGASAGVIGRSSSKGSQLLGSSSRVASPVVAPNRPPAPGTRPRGRPIRERRIRKHRKPRSTGQRVLRWSVISVAFVLVMAGGMYGYLRYRLGQIKTISCTTCAAVANGAPYNVLIVGSDSRAGNTGAAAKSFGNATQVAGQRSDTIKVLHIDPASGTARLLSIPRDTYVALSGMPSGTGLATDNKINTAFNSGPVPLIQTIESTFGVSISHFVIVDFSGVIDMVNSVGGIKLNFPYPVRDNYYGNNNSGLSIPQAGCQTLNGDMALALSRSRYYQYEVRPGVWVKDGSSDFGRIQRQNTVIAAVINKAKSSYNPLTVNSFLGAIVKDITVDDKMSTGTMLSLAQRYHAFSGSALQTFTLPTSGSVTSGGSDVLIVQEPAAQQVLTQFLGVQPSAVVTPPINAYGSPISVPSTTVPSGSSSGSGSTGATGPSGASTPATPVPGTGPFNPTPC